VEGAVFVGVAGDGEATGVEVAEVGRPAGPDDLAEVCGAAEPGDVFEDWEAVGEVAEVPAAVTVAPLTVDLSAAWPESGDVGDP
jgi:hypothetical protein